MTSNPTTAPTAERRFHYDYRRAGRDMSDVYKLTQKSVWTNNVGRHTTWYLLDERKMGYYIDYIEWSVQRDWGVPQA